MQYISQDGAGHLTSKTLVDLLRVRVLMSV